MKTIKLVIAMVVGMMVLHSANAQKTNKVKKQLYWQVDLSTGSFMEGEYHKSTLCFYREKWLLAIGHSTISYRPADIPNDFDEGKEINSIELVLAGYGKFIPTAHKSLRVLIRADAAFGKYNEKVNFKNTGYKGGGGWLTELVSSKYEYERIEGYAGGLHLLAKAEICSRRVSLGINIDSYITTKIIIVGGGISVGFGKLRRKNN